MPDPKQHIEGWNIDTLKEYVSALINSNDRRYQESFAAAKEAVAAALAAQKELTNAAFASSEKAITKAEEAQRDYNVRSNEFRGQLDDQAKTLMPRTETNVLMQAQNERISDHGKQIETMLMRLTTLDTAGATKSDSKGNNMTVIGLICTVVSVVILIIVTLIKK